MKLLILLVFIGLFSSCNNHKVENIDDSGRNIKIITADDMPQTRNIESIEGKRLNENLTLQIIPDIFFETETSIRSGISIDSGRLYFGNEKNEFYAIDINTKQMLWKYSADTAVQTNPVITDSKIIFNAGDSLYILNAVNGEELFKITYPSNNSFRASFNSYVFNDSYTAVKDGIAYFAAPDGSIIAVDINSGDILWTLPSGIKSRGEVASGINFYNNKLYYIDYFGFLCSIDIETKQFLFKTEIRDRFSSIHIDNDKIYAAGRNKKIFCIDANTGDVIWSSFSYDPTTWFSGGSVIIGNVIYSGTSDERSIVAFNKDTGDFLRFYPAEFNVFTPPVLNGENIVLAAVNVYSKRQSSIMEFDTKNHIKLWQVDLEDGVFSAPIIYQDVLYFGSDSGRIYSIKLN